ncbi:MAG: hypothetical protein Q4D21_03145 [Phascolarctobacterium sp.]|nr:hypothetical protein [Phascolarctobacterium sp.]
MSITIANGVRLVLFGVRAESPAGIAIMAGTVAVGGLAAYGAYKLCSK